MNNVLIVDDEPNYLIVLSELLREEGLGIFTAKNGEEALKILGQTDIDLIITDMLMPGLDGQGLLKAAKVLNPDLPVIMITAFGEVEMAVAAMKAGAFNYLTKPFNNDELVLNTHKALEHYSLLRENMRLREEMRFRTSFANMVGKNQKMQTIFNLIEKVAPTSTSVLITGESGTGKELVARAIHCLSPREKAPFISLNCAGLPENLLESELFGHEKGAFTGAIALRKGRFELADTGSLFLDEIGEMAMPLQAKILRVLQERSFERVGSSQTLRVDVRIIAATNRDLKDEVDKGHFREDLYYRLNVLHIHLPPLRERTDDIPMLVAHFVNKYAKQLDKPKLEIATETVRFLMSLPWEGNIRELENTIERAAILCNRDLIRPEDVQPETMTDKKPLPWLNGFDLEQAIPANITLPDVLDGIEKKMVFSALEKANYVQTKAADTLGITKSLLQYKMKKHGVLKR